MVRLNVVGRVRCELSAQAPEAQRQLSASACSAGGHIKHRLPAWFVYTETKELHMHNNLLLSYYRTPAKVLDQCACKLLQPGPWGLRREPPLSRSLNSLQLWDQTVAFDHVHAIKIPEAIRVSPELPQLSDPPRPHRRPFRVG